MTIDVLAIAGAGRSGSTLLEGMIADATRSASIGEAIWIWERGFRRDELCGCGERFQSCSFWTAVAVEAFGGLDQVPSERLIELQGLTLRRRYIPYLLGWGRPPTSFNEHLNELRELLSRFYGAIDRVAEGRLILDSSKHGAYLQVLAGSPGLTTRTVHLVRDARAVAFSWSRPKLRPEIHWDRQMMRTYGTLTATKMWIGDNLMASTLRRTTEYQMIRYEDLVDDPEQWVVELAAGCGNRPSGDSIVHSIGGNPARFERHAPIRSDDRWRTEMATWRQWTVRLLTLPFELVWPRQRD